MDPSSCKSQRVSQYAEAVASCRRAIIPISYWQAAVIYRFVSDVLSITLAADLLIIELHFHWTQLIFMVYVLLLNVNSFHASILIIICVEHFSAVRVSQLMFKGRNASPLSAWHWSSDNEMKTPSSNRHSILLHWFHQQYYETCQK